MSAWSLRTKIGVSFCAMTLMLVAVTFLAFHTQTRRVLQSGLNPAARSQARRIVGRLRRGEAASQAGPSGHRLHESFAVFDPDRMTLLASSPDLPRGWRPESLIERALERGRRGTTATVDLPDGRSMQAFAAVFPREPAGAPDGPGYLVVAMEPLDSVRSSLLELVERLVKTLPLTLILAVVCAWILSRWLARPLREMASAAEHAEASGTDGLVPGSGAGDEIDALAASLNRAFSRLRGALARQGRFAADAAHELRTPMAAILGRSDSALQTPRSHADYEAALRDVRDAARRASDTLESLLVLARIDADAEQMTECVDLAAVVDDEVRAARARWNLSADDLRHAHPTADCLVKGNHGQLSVLTRNLIENALIHGQSARGTDVVLDRRDGVFRLGVRDHGPGIPAAIQAIAFERFRRTDASRSRKTGGSGLGLAIVRAVAEQHAGTARLTSTPGEGTEVAVDLPAVA